MEIENQQAKLKPQLVMKRKNLTGLPFLNTPRGSFFPKLIWLFRE